MVAFFGTDIFANNLVMGTPSINAASNTISFTIKWDNSWYVSTGPSNWDAVWVFVKRQACNQATQNPWVHADLAASGHSLSSTSQLQIDLASDNKGVFIRRNAAGKGNITQVTVTLTLASAVSTDNIGFNKGIGTCDRAVHMRFGRKIDNGVDVVIGDGTIDDGCVANIALYEGVARVVGHVA
mgnify:CR=1 FL=1